MGSVLDMRAGGLDPAERDAVVFVNRFTVHASTEDFERTFSETSEFMASQPGFVAHTLARHAEQPGAYVNVAYWRDEESFRRALAQPGFAPHAIALRALATSDPNLYRPAVHHDAAPAAAGGIGPGRHTR
ncbi:antibiotic biosynthesis monooxygenase family protein [Micromonospora arborensis]|nr:antibiotic biosynthesis monooxygenase family protein [Micromonospora arborensis]